MATTPPPPTDLRTPPTPRFGAGYDQYEPYATRHSARIAGQQSRGSLSASPSSGPETQAQADAKGGKKPRGNGFRALSPPEPSNDFPRTKGAGRTSAFTQTHSLSNTSDPFISAPPSLSHQPSTHPPGATMTDGMLPTPVKTPKKKAVADAGSTARSLFATSSMSGRGKKNKRPAAYSLESFENGSGQDQTKIEIYTDSRDRIPELDESEENPFYARPSVSNASGKTTGRSSRGRKAEESKRDDEVDKALHRDDGMFYVFRGKRFFRKFNDEAESEPEDDEDLGLLASRPDLVDSSTMTTRPLTRSSIKPRMLFPGANDHSQEEPMSEADEEAATDIEDNEISKDSANETDHAADVEMQNDPATPPAKSTVPTPAGPGATLRTLRSRTKRDVAECDVTPTTKRKTISPFAGWQRKKQSPPSGTTTPRKRDAGTGSPGEPATKKTRSNRATVGS